MQLPSRPAIFHVTHAKAGSTWIANILRDAFGEPVFPWFGGKAHRYRWQPGAIYPGIFLSYDDFLKLERSEDSVVFYVIRDIRDSLVSLYFSLKYTHGTRGFPKVQRFRDRTRELDDFESIHFLFTNYWKPLARKQRSWLESGMPLIRYEELIATEGGALPPFLRGLGCEFDEETMASALDRNRFENVFGRKLGERNNASLGRQGLPGDWRHFATPRLEAFIEENLRDLLDQAGYGDASEDEARDGSDGPTRERSGSLASGVDLASEDEALTGGGLALGQEPGFSFAYRTPLMVGGSYLFTGRFDAVRGGKELERRIRLIARRRNGRDDAELLFEPRVGNLDWSFRLMQRIPPSVSGYTLIAEARSCGSEWSEVASHEFGVKVWDLARWSWAANGMLRYGRMLWKALRIARRHVAARYMPSTAWFAIESDWRKFLKLCKGMPPEEVWREQLNEFEKRRVWLRIESRREFLGNFYQYPARDLVFERFPGLGRGPQSALKLTVVTPSYQQGEFLARTMDSVLGQQADGIDYIVMDGGSTDGSLAAIRAREDQLKYWTSGSDGGQSEAIRRGFSKMDCGGDDIMAYLNSDDLFCPGAIPFVLRIFEERPELDVIYGHRIVIDALDREVGRWVLPPHDPELVKLVDFIPQETLFWRRRIYDQVGGINPCFKFAMDWDLILRFQSAGAVFERVPWYLSCFRAHDAQKTNTELASVGLEEMGRLRARENGGSPVAAEVIWEAVRRSRVESAWYQERLKAGERL